MHETVETKVSMREILLNWFFHSPSRQTLQKAGRREEREEKGESRERVVRLGEEGEKKLTGSSHHSHQTCLVRRSIVGGVVERVRRERSNEFFSVVEPRRRPRLISLEHESLLDSVRRVDQ